MKSREPREVTLTINGQTVTVPFGTRILDAARTLGIDVPTLCEHPWIHRLASCRLCLVRVAGVAEPVASCATEATEGMVVTTHDDELARLRRQQLTYILINHPTDCPVCDKAGECRLQDLTYELGVTSVPFAARSGPQTIDKLSPLIERNDERCIRCGRCVAVCQEVQAVGAYRFAGRGYDTRIDTREGGPLDCEFCGQCVAACPVGALLCKPFKHRARVWDLRKVETVCGYCGAGCQIELNVWRDRVRRVTSDVAATTNEGKLCIRGAFGWDIVHDERRQTTPMMRRDGELRPVTWDEALDAVAEGIRHALATGGPEAVGALAGPRLAVEDAYALAYVFGGIVGTRRVAISGQDAYGTAMKVIHDRLGRPGSTATFADLREADAILALGTDLAAEMPVPALAAIAAVREGDARLVAAHPVPTKLDEFAAVRLRYRPGSQVSLLLLVLRALVDRRGQNLDFIRKRTEGFAAFKAGLDRLDVAALLAKTGVTREAVDAAVAALAAASRPVIVLGAQALMAEVADQITGLAIDLLLALGRVENGLLLSTDRSDLFGSMLAGLVPGRGPGLKTYSEVPAGWPQLPEEPGLGYAGIIEAGMAGRLGALLVFGANPLVQTPKAETLRRAMEVTGLVVACDSFLTTTANQAHIFLPTTNFAERGGHVVSAEGRLLTTNAAVKPPEGAWPEWRILAAIAARLDQPIGEESLAGLWREVKAHVPDLAAAEAATDGRRGGLLPRLALASDRPACFGKLPTPNEPPASDMVLVTGPVFQHCGTLSANSAAIAQVCPKPWLELNGEDARARDLAPGDLADVTAGGVTLRVPIRVNDGLPAGIAFAPVHFAEFPAGRLLDRCPCAAVEIVRAR